MTLNTLASDPARPLVAEHFAATEFLIVPGLGNSGPDHWQTQWQHELRAQRVEQANWHEPDLEQWATAVETTLLGRPRPTVVIAHSFGCLASVLAAARQPARVQALFLAAPADPERFSGTAKLRQQPPVPTLLVASRNDPHMAFADAVIWAQYWHSRFIDAGAVGHINPASGHGRWDDGWSTLTELLVYQEAAI